MIVVARTGPIAPPRFRSMVFIPRPTVMFSLGSEMEIMLTMGIIMETTPTSETATSNVRYLEALEEVYQTITQEHKNHLHTHFEIIALASHNPKIKKIIVEDYQKDIEARTFAELFTSLYMGTMAKLVIGFPDQEIHDYWIRSMLLILGKTKITNPISKSNT
jgi:hypothetical protein